MQFTVDTSTALATLGAAALAVIAVIILTRLNGLLSFAKMAPHDFASTVAIGSLLATTATGAVPVLQGMAGLVGVYATQRAFQWWRRYGGHRWTDNTPVLLMAGDEVLEDNLHAAGMAHPDLVAKLREANVTDPTQVHAVVLETTGDVSVLHGDPESGRLDPSLLEHVRGLPEGADRPASWVRTAGT